MRSSKNKNPCFDCLASEKENEEVCRTIRAILNKHNSVQVEMKDPGSIGTLTIGDCTYNVYLGNTTLNKLRCLCMNFYIASTIGWDARVEPMRACIWMRPNTRS